MRFSKQKRQEIIDDFIRKNGGYDAQAFLREVRSSNGTHPAWSWFQWNDGAAAEEYRLWQARTFTQGLRVVFTVEVTERHVSGVRAVPALLSPLDNRRNGGGYYAVDPQDEAHMAEVRLQGAASLETWMRRYGDAFELAGGDLDPFYAAVALLRPADEKEAA